MKKVTNVINVDGEGLVGLLGERVTLFCANYFYTGELSGVNTDTVLLIHPSIVYETGPFSEKTWKDAQALPGPLYVRIASIEAYGIVK